MLYLIFHQQNIAHDRKCVQYYSVRRAVIPFTDCEMKADNEHAGWWYHLGGAQRRSHKP